MESKIYNALPSGSGVYKRKKTGLEVSYCKKKEMKDLYPAGGFSVVGQVGRGRDEIGELHTLNASEKIYAVSSMPHSKIKGYIKVGENEYLAVVKSVLLLWLLLILLILALAGLAAFFIHRAVTAGANEPETTTEARVIDPNAVLGEGELEVPDKIDTSSRQIKINGITTMNLKAGQVEQAFVFSNPEENPCYFVIEIEVDATGEILYTSNLLPPGYSISRFSLNRALEAGEYPVTVHFKTYSFDKEQRELNNMDVKTTIVAS